MEYADNLSLLFDFKFLELGSSTLAEGGICSAFNRVTVVRAQGDRSVCAGSFPKVGVGASPPFSRGLSDLQGPWEFPA